MSKSSLVSAPCSCTRSSEHLESALVRTGLRQHPSSISTITPTPVMFPPSSRVRDNGNSKFEPTPMTVSEFFCDSRKVFTTNAEYCEIDNIGGCEPLTHGRIFFPKISGVKSAGPIVLICHGLPPNSSCKVPFYQAFDGLLSCIAAHGMIAVSIECSNSDNPKDRANRILNQLLHIKSVIGKKGVTLAGDEPLALVGHSNGGEAVAIAAEAIRLGTIKSAFTFVESVVHLAPAHVVPKFYSSNQFCRNQLLIQGGLDGNIDPEVGFGIYEDFFRVTMIQGQALPNSFQSAIFLSGGTHSGLSAMTWNSKCGVKAFAADVATQNEVDGMLEPNGQMFVVKAYVAAFLEMTLRGASKFKRWFTGDIVPIFIHPDPVIQADLDAKLKISVSHAEASSSTLLCNDASCAQSFGLTALSQINLSTLNPQGPDRLAFRAEWDLSKNTNPRLVFNFPELEFPPLDDLFLEFDVAQLPGITTTLEFKVSVLAPFNNVSATVVVPPQQVVSFPINRSMVLSTIRIPMNLFPTTSETFSGVFMNFSKSSLKGTVMISFPRISP